MYKIFLSPTGRMARSKFWLGFIGLVIFIFLVNKFLKHSAPNEGLKFWVATIYVFLVLHVIYCVYGKRLHDMGHTFWPLTGMIFLEFLVIIAIMLSFGGAEYFAAFAEYEKEAVIDEVVRKQLITDYQDHIKANMHIIGPLMLCVPLVFTFWVGVKAGQDHDNVYGPKLA